MIYDVAVFIAKVKDGRFISLIWGCRALRFFVKPRDEAVGMSLFQATSGPESVGKADADHFIFSIRCSRNK